MKKRLGSSKVLEFFSSKIKNFRNPKNKYYYESKSNSKSYILMGLNFFNFRTSALKHLRTSYRFTMVEITMAVAIIGIGMAGVMALLPVGFNATRDAIGENYSSNMAEQFLHVMAQQCTMYEGGYGTPVTKDGWGDWVISESKIPNENPPIDTELTAVEKKTSGGAMFGDGDGGNDKDAAGIYYDDNAVSGAFYVEAKSGDIVDFSGVMAVWKEQIVINESGDKIPYTHGVRLNLEISWPPGKPYDMREKRTYVLELFNPNDR